MTNLIKIILPYCLGYLVYLWLVKRYEHKRHLSKEKLKFDRRNANVIYLGLGLIYGLISICY